MNLSRAFAWLLLGVVLPHPVQGAPVQPIDLSDFGSPTFTTFSPLEGVPETVINSIAVDREGFVWLASPAGLARYDGQRWSMVDDPAAAGNPSSVMVDSHGTLWVTYYDRGISRYDGVRWHRYTQASGLPSSAFHGINETHDAAGKSELWVVSINAPWLRLEGDRWVPVPVTPAGPHGVLSVQRTQRLGGSPRLWVATFNEGLWFQDSSGWHSFNDPTWKPGVVIGLATTRSKGQEQLWIGTFGSGLWRLDANGLKHWGRSTGDLPSDDLYNMVVAETADGEATIWAPSRAGLIRVHNDRLALFDSRHGLPSSVVRGLSIWRSPDGINVLWLATETGVARTVIGASQWTTATLLGAGNSGVFGSLVEPDGKGGERLWVASNADGVALYEGGQWRHFLKELPDTDAYFIKRFPDENGLSTLWMGMRNGYLVKIHEGPRFEVLPTPWERGNNQIVQDLLVRRFEGHYEQWVATRETGIYRKRDGVWTAFQPPGVVGHWRVTALLEQVDSHRKSWLWATTNQGLARFDGLRWDLLGREVGLSTVHLRGMNLFTDEAGHPVLWVGSEDGGLIRLNVVNPLQPRALPSSELPPPPDNSVYTPIKDSKGRIYLCTNVGVQQLTATSHGYSAKLFSRRDGMVHEECNTGGQSIDAHDRFWTGTLGGLAVFDPEPRVRDRHSKPLKLVSVRVDGRRVGPSATVEVPAGTHEVRIDYALLSWQRESESRFRTQLDGYEDKPTEWTPQSFRTFSHLEPARYRFSVEARDYGNRFSTPLELTLEVLPAWWQTDWTRGLALLLAAAAAYGLVDWRTRSVNAARRQLARKVASRTAELNAANARLLDLSYRDPLTGLANRRRLLETLEGGAREEAPPTLGALIFIDVDFFKQYNDRFGHPAGDEALRCVAQAMVTCSPPTALAARYGGEEFACLLTGTDAPTAGRLAERIREVVASSQVAVPGTTEINQITISAGVARASLRTAADAHRLLRDADIALYQAKRDGRNRVRVSTAISDG
jgi:diguanylate cyclase (GGDEF)-like protein